MSPSAPARNEFPTEAMGFHTTHWTIVLGARDGDGAAAQQALAGLCSTYWYPLYAFIRRSGYTPQDAEDLTQGFFCAFLGKDSLTKVDPQAGKFRSYLLVCLKHYMSNERRRAQAQRRGAGIQVLRLDHEGAETRYLAEPADNVTPDVLYEKRWAFEVLDRALANLRQEYSRRDKSALFDDLRGLLPGDGTSISRTDLAVRHGLSAGATDVAIHRFRRRFGALLRAQVSQTVSCADEVEQELRYLISVLGS